MSIFKNFIIVNYWQNSYIYFFGPQWTTLQQGVTRQEWHACCYANMTFTLEENMQKTRILLIFLLILGAGIRLYHLDYKSLSIDETIGAFYAQEPAPRIWIMTINDVHPPLFYLVHHVWLQIFGSSEMATRSISVFFALLTVIVLYLLARRLFNSVTALTAVLLLVFSPWHIWISQNGRSNAMLLFLICSSSLFLLQVLQSRQKRWYILYGITTLLAILTHYFAFMIWAAQCIFVSIYAPTHRRLASTWQQVNLAVLLGYFVWLPFMISQFMTKTRPMYKVFSVQFLKNLFDYLNPYAAVPYPGLFYAGAAVMLSLFVYGLLQSKRTQIQITFVRNGQIEPKIKKRLLLGFGTAVLLNLIGALYFNVNRTLPILIKQILQNSSIYATSIKPYHLDQLHSLQTCFLAAAIIGLLIMLGIWGVVRFSANSATALKNTGSVPTVSFFLLMLLMPLALAALLSLKSPYLLLRNMVIILPFYLMIVAHGTMQLPLRWRWPAALALLLITFFSLTNYEAWYQKDDWRSAADFIKKNHHPQDTVLLDHLFGKKPLYYYGVESHRPLRRGEWAGFLNQLHGDLWILRSYRNDWCVMDSTEKYLTRTGEWSFTGSTNPDDLIPVDGKLLLIHYHQSAAKPNSNAVATR